jgi:hypothetical protein
VAAAERCQHYGEYERKRKRREEAFHTPVYNRAGDRFV